VSIGRGGARKTGGKEGEREEAYICINIYYLYYIYISSLWEM
jgi:hypothetical protein